jgi:hypothetical protein
MSIVSIEMERPEHFENYFSECLEELGGSITFVCGYGVGKVLGFRPEHIVLSLSAKRPARFRGWRKAVRIESGNFGSGVRVARKRFGLTITQRGILRRLGMGDAFWVKLEKKESDDE